MRKSAESSPDKITGGVTVKSGIFQIIIIFVIVLLTRLPFLSAGYGTDSDAWRVAAVARNISVTGLYGYSRVPGHPVQEIICSLFWNNGPLWLNGLTAIMSALAVVFFVLILRKLSFKNIYLPALAFALTPVIFINSVNCMDHLWALAFILASTYFVLDNKPVAAGIMLGVANGCRLTSVFMMIPLSILLFYNFNPNPKKSIRNFFGFSLAGAIVTLILFTPGLMRYGLDLFTDFTGPYARLPDLAYRMLVGTWGLTGMTIIFAAFAVQLFYRIKSRRNNSNQKPKWDRYADASLYTAVILFLILFLFMPYKSNYLIPAIPFFLLLSGRFLNRSLFNVVCISLIVSPFLLTLNRTDVNVLPDYSAYSVKMNIKGNEVVFDLPGPVLSQHSRRLKQLEYIKKIFARGGLVTRKSVVITADTYPLIDVMLPYNIQGKVVYESLLDSAQLSHTIGEGYDIYYLPYADKVMTDTYNINMNDFGAKKFIDW